MRTVLATALLCFATVAPATEPVDHCGTVLGSLAVELRLARQLPAGRKTTYSCAKRYTPLVGATRERVLRVLGTPDRTADDGGWAYVFASKYGEVPEGTPELVFRFGAEGLVDTIDCHRTKA